MEALPEQVLLDPVLPHLGVQQLQPPREIHLAALAAVHRPADAGSQPQLDVHDGLPLVLVRLGEVVHRGAGRAVQIGKKPQVLDDIHVAAAAGVVGIPECGCAGGGPTAAGLGPGDGELAAGTRR